MDSTGFPLGCVLPGQSVKTKTALTTSQEGIFHFRKHGKRLKRMCHSSLAFLGKFIHTFLFQFKFLPLQRLKHCRTHEFLLSAQIRVCLRLRVITVNCSAQYNMYNTCMIMVYIGEKELLCVAHLFVSSLSSLSSSIFVFIR